MRCSLREWQELLKPTNDLIVNASATDGSDSWTPFPIGMAYHYANCGHPAARIIMLGQHDKLVFCGFSTHTDKHRRANETINRKTIMEALQSNGIHNVTYKDMNDYYSQLPKYKFVIAPEGNGIDTHRLYEALIAGCIPIVEDRPEMWIKYDGCPILWTKDYSEITPAYLEAKYKKMLDESYDFSRLFLSFYGKQAEQIRANTAHWCSYFGTRWRPL